MEMICQYVEPVGQDIKLPFNWYGIAATNQYMKITPNYLRISPSIKYMLEVLKKPQNNHDNLGQANK